MEIRELHIKNFGKFTDQHFVLEQGIHVFYGENEYGKSTIFAFIKAMLFGLERGRGRAAQSDEFSRYEPWDNPNYFAGTMRFTSGGKGFCLERCFDRYNKNATLVCEDDGEELSVNDGDLEMLLGGMTKELFEDIVAIGQLTAKPGQSLTEELKNYAANFYETGTNRVDLSGALEALKQSRKSVEQEIKRLTEEEYAKKEALYQKSQYVLEDNKKLEKELKENQKKLNNFKYKSELGSHSNPVPTQRLHTNRDSKFNQGFPDRTTFMGLVVGILCILAGLGGPARSSGVFWIIGPILCIAVGIQFFLELKGEKQKGDREEKRGDKKQEIDQQAKNYQKLEWENQRIQAEWKEKGIKYENLQEQIEEMESSTEKMKGLQTKRQSILLAEETLIKAAHSVAKGFGRKFHEHASEILSQITSGKYKKLLMDEQLAMILFEEGQRIPIERVSRGTMEQVYFAVRMAAVDMLCQEQIPLIFDEAFAYYDEKRLKAAIRWLGGQHRQVILFSCQRREQDLVKQDCV